MAKSLNMFTLLFVLFGFCCVIVGSSWWATEMKGNGFVGALLGFLAALVIRGVLRLVANIGKRPSPPA